MNLLNFIADAAAGAAGTNGEVAAGGGWIGMLTMLIPLALMILVFYFLLIRPEKKRAREQQNMLDNLQVADEVVTNGGIIGLIISVQKDTVLIETGSDRTKIRVLKSAIAKNNTTHDEEAVIETKSKSKPKKDIK